MGKKETFIEKYFINKYDKKMDDTALKDEQQFIRVLSNDYTYIFDDKEQHLLSILNGEQGKYRKTCLLYFAKKNAKLASLLLHLHKNNQYKLSSKQISDFIETLFFCDYLSMADVIKYWIPYLNDTLQSILAIKLLDESYCGKDLLKLLFISHVEHPFVNIVFDHMNINQKKDVFSVLSSSHYLLDDFCKELIEHNEYDLLETRFHKLPKSCLKLIYNKFYDKLFIETKNRWQIFLNNCITFSDFIDNDVKELLVKKVQAPTRLDTIPNILQRIKFNKSQENRLKAAVYMNKLSK